MKNLQKIIFMSFFLLSFQEIHCQEIVLTGHPNPQFLHMVNHRLAAKHKGLEFKLHMTDLAEKLTKLLEAPDNVTYATTEFSITKLPEDGDYELKLLYGYTFSKIDPDHPNHDFSKTVPISATFQVKNLTISGLTPRQIRDYNDLQLSEKGIGRVPHSNVNFTLKDNREIKFTLDEHDAGPSR